ncbi:MAG: hypothetical protein HGGPFJEG_03152 [Ignavibacteria bacterium]|nr:hypothetical protein [Ignavibacteria bacterium]
MKTLLKIFLLFCFYIFNFIDAEAQPSITWNRLYNGPFNWYDESYDICQTSDGNFIAVGYTRNPNYSICALKINNYGDTLWFRIIPNNFQLVRRALSVTSLSSGGCLITGESDSLFILKLDIWGNVEWYKIIGSSYERGYCITATADNNFIICGFYGLLMKIDENGSIIWKKYYPANLFKSVINSIDGGYIVVGTYSIGSLSYAKIIKTDTAGKLIWQNIFIVNNSTAAVAVVSLNNSYVICGMTNAQTGQIWENFISKIDINGNLYFTKLYVSKNSEYFNDMIKYNDNSLVICSELDSNGAEPYNISKAYLLDTTGNIKKDRKYFSNETQYMYSIARVANGDIIFSGSARKQTIGGIDDIWIVRTDSLLNSPNVNISSNENLLFSKYKLYQNYPNPFNSRTKIKFESENTNNLELKIYDNLGKMISSYTLNNVQSGNNEIIYDPTNLCSGIYYYSLSINSKLIQSRKMIIIK